MTVRLHSFVRKQFPVQAIRVTPANIEELAAFCGGELKHDGEKEGNFSRDYIKVDAKGARTEEQTKARVGDWLVKQGRTWKVYKDKAFRSAFESKNRVTVEADAPTPANMPATKPMEVRSPEAAQARRTEDLAQSGTELFAGPVPTERGDFERFYASVLAGDTRVTDDVLAEIHRLENHFRSGDTVESAPPEAKPITLDELNSQPGDPRTAEDIHREG